MWCGSRNQTLSHLSPFPNRWPSLPGLTTRAVSPFWILPAGVLRFTFKFELLTGPCPFISRSKGMHSADVASVQALGHSVAHGWLKLEATAQCPIHRLSLQTPHHTTHMLHLKPVKMSTWARVTMKSHDASSSGIAEGNSECRMFQLQQISKLAPSTNIHYLSLLPV